MLSQIDLERTIPKDEYRARLPKLQDQLYQLEQTLLEARMPTLIIFEGWAGTSKIGMIDMLTRRLDPRGVRVHPITPPRTYETNYPWLYRFWLRTPRYGQIALFDRSWYREVIAARTRADLGNRSWRDRCEDMVAFERQLTEDGAAIVKFWLHIAHKEQKHRFKKLREDPLTAWQVTDEDRWQNRHYDAVQAAVEDLMARTNTPQAPWIVIPATDRLYTHLAILEATLTHLNTCLARKQQRHVLEMAPPVSVVETTGTTIPLGSEPLPTPPASLGILRQANLSLKVDDRNYSSELTHLQVALRHLGFQVYSQKRPVILIFEGWDAAGKGGVIKRVTEQLDPRGYVVHSIAAPAGDDREHHYLYRFWRRLPQRGEIAIFDRSWYGRVLVERVEGFALPHEWQRSYTEINEFERQLVEFGTIICKFWLQISPEEQLRRFEERQNIPYKAWKLTDEDWRNRARWPEYESAADEMLLRTSTPTAPWTLVEAEDKRFARIKVLRTVVQRLEPELRTGRTVVER